MNKFEEISFFEELAGNNKKYDIKLSRPNYTNWNIVSVLSTDKDTIKFDFISKEVFGAINKITISEKFILDIHLYEIVEFREHDDRGYTKEWVESLVRPPKY